MRRVIIYDQDGVQIDFFDSSPTLSDAKVVAVSAISKLAPGSFAIIGEPQGGSFALECSVHRICCGIGASYRGIECFTPSPPLDQWEVMRAERPRSR